MPSLFKPTLEVSSRNKNIASAPFLSFLDVKIIQMSGAEQIQILVNFVCERVFVFNVEIRDASY